MPKKVICAISGGVDSAVTAALLKKQGFNVEAVFFRLAETANFQAGAKRARRVAKILKIPFRVLDLRKSFKKEVIDYFIKEYQAGRTPNPCVVCNKRIKFDWLLKLGADLVSTGHYARTENGRLFQAKDKEKDQSYFLWQLSQRQLKRILFPLGDYSKKEVKSMAKRFNLPVFEAPESQEICFQVPKIKQKPGVIVNVQGKILGKHQGLIFHTVGQRKGIGLPGGPYWVLDKDLKKNVLVVTGNERDLLKKELSFKNVNWISGKKPKFPLRVKAKIRYRHKLATGIIKKGNKFVFNQPQRAITPGQSIVFYRGQELLGGAIID